MAIRAPSRLAILSIETRVLRMNACARSRAHVYFSIIARRRRIIILNLKVIEHIDWRRIYRCTEEFNADFARCCLELE
jgi:hypothetical protein